MFRVGHLPRGARHRLRGKAQPDSAPHLDALRARAIWTIYLVLLTPLSTSTLATAKLGELAAHRLTQLSWRHCATFFFMEVVWTEVFSRIRKQVILCKARGSHLQGSRSILFWVIYLFLYFWLRFGIYAFCYSAGLHAFRFQLLVTVKCHMFTYNLADATHSALKKPNGYCKHSLYCFEMNS